VTPPRQNGTPPHNANGHRRRRLTARVLTEEHTCALCGQPVDKTLTTITGQHGPRCRGDCTGCARHPMSPVVDEDIPRARGGSPYQRSNCHLMHRRCNAWKATRTLAEARARLAGVTMATPKTVEASPIW
jgi:5-methylcytosine-specific restriction endonuclease McrA